MSDLIEIINKCKKNDRKAQKVLYDRYASSLLGICMRYAKDRAEAEDILQDGFLKILLNINQFAGSGSFEGWMKRIIINTSITHYHNNIKHNRHENIDKIREIKLEDTETEVEFSHEELLKVIKELPEGYKMIFNLYAVEGYKHREIAEMLNIDEGTSKSQYSRAKKIIQDKLYQLKNVVSVA